MANLDHFNGRLFTVRNEVAKVKFLHLSVSNSVHRGCLPQCMLGYHPPGPGTPPEQTPPEQTPPEQTPPRARHPLGQAPPGTRHPPSPGTRHPPPPRQQTATVADGTHPTGMHSCCLLNFNYVSLSNIELDLVLFNWPNLCFPKDFPKLPFKN